MSSTSSSDVSGSRSQFAYSVPACPARVGLKVPPARRCAGSGGRECRPRAPGGRVRCSRPLCRRVRRRRRNIGDRGRLAGVNRGDPFSMTAGCVGARYVRRLGRRRLRGRPATGPPHGPLRHRGLGARRPMPVSSGRGVGCVHGRLNPSGTVESANRARNRTRLLKKLYNLMEITRLCFNSSVVAGAA